ncbi:udp-glucose dehydrogenase, putative [Ichthyophthirius multifiliis]|uniref:Udp-glucose dehydrogenase, putative n=1 Tax=Ichthyophthirius multifiliis TaxID=5932 RepID=G0QQ02_ICHMU|nr:udp-glucose dehydrogenase, putative [Ichthyophthirius multifiliis]EGR32701.1 udp-glucose dehydrogenase, putative [Ichthyophthirius multifiliis]|eukprot:XP_004036687.1 udp-glucose dehydrogenase, putative [Ichthyophthirius multifiliis]
MNSQKVSKITCFGAGYVGGPTMAVFSKYHQEIKFIVYDVNESIIKQWQFDQQLPVFELGLSEIIKQQLCKNLFFTSDLNEALQNTDIIFIAVSTPTKEKGRGAGKSLDLRYLEESDILGLCYLCEFLGLKETQEYWFQVLKLNEYQKQRFTDTIIEKMYNNVSNKILTIFGVAFKKNTNDVRESASISVCSNLLINGAILNIYDPQVQKNAFINEMQNQNLYTEDYFQKINFFNQDYLKSVESSHCIVILTEWDEFKTFEYSQMFLKMKRPTYIFDGRNLLDQDKIEQIGFAYVKLG